MRKICLGARVDGEFTYADLLDASAAAAAVPLAGRTDLACDVVRVVRVVYVATFG
jgi:hypothetical protein